MSNIKYAKDSQVQDYHRDKCIVKMAEKLSNEPNGISYLMGMRHNQMQDAILNNKMDIAKSLSSYSIADAKQEFNNMQQKVDIKFLNTLCGTKQDAWNQSRVWESLRDS